MHPDRGIFPSCHNSDHVQIDACRQYVTMLVVGVVSAQFCPSRCRKNGNFPTAAVQLHKTVNGTQQPVPISFRQIFTAAKYCRDVHEFFRLQQSASLLNCLQYDAPFSNRFFG